jgi:hypothetical protein
LLFMAQVENRIASGMRVFFLQFWDREIEVMYHALAMP